MDIDYCLVTCCTHVVLAASNVATMECNLRLMDPPFWLIPSPSGMQAAVPCWLLDHAAQSRLLPLQGLVCALRTR